jgi:hypothetical protein
MVGRRTVGPGSLEELEARRGGFSRELGFWETIVVSYYY